MFKRGIGIIFLLMLLFVVACSKDEEAEANGDENKENDMEEHIDGKESILDEVEEAVITSVASRADLKTQQGGKLSADIAREDEVKESTDEQLDQDAKKELKMVLTDLTNETQKPKEIYKGLVYLLGSPNYREVIEDAESFAAEFEDPYLPDPRKSTEEVEDGAKQGKAIILLDASSSMLLSVDNQLKMDIAKEAVKRFGEAIGQENDLSLVVYGHEGSEAAADKQLSCNGIEEVYPMGPYKKESFEKSLTTFESKGYTPLAGAIKKAAEMSRDFSENVTLYIVSDGVETCDGDPVKEAKDFVTEDSDRIVNIIGFHVEKAEENQLKKVSEAGNGEYYPANNATELKTTIEKEWLPSMLDLAWAFTKAPDGWETLAEYERFDEDLNEIKAIIKNEKARYDEALQMIRNENLLDQEASGQLGNIISEQNSKLTELMRDFRSEKLAEIDDSAKEIRDRVSEWTDEMRKRKEERGDQF